MTAVDFVQGVDAIAPGLTRAQEPLRAALERHWTIRSIRFPSARPRYLFPWLYGPFPALEWLHRPDLVHIANSWYAHAVPLLPQPTVVTCHDLIEWREIWSGSRRARPHRRFHAAAGFKGMLQATRIVCDSRAVANQIAAVAPGVSDRLRVVHLGIGEQFRPGGPDYHRLRALGVKPPYVLYVGSEQERKNLPRLVAAIARVRKLHPDLQFVKVGASQTAAGRDALLAAIAASGMTDSSRILEGIEDDDLVTLYRAAATTALVSLEEGFGFPALEAMACGSPVLVSDRDSLPEITGGHAEVVNPLDTVAIAEGLQRLLSGARNDGAAHAAGFTWTRAADQYGVIYREVLET